jgi:hypothetical protein
MEVGPDTHPTAVPEQPMNPHPKPSLVVASSRTDHTLLAALASRHICRHLWRHICRHVMTWRPQHRRSCPAALAADPATPRLASLFRLPAPLPAPHLASAATESAGGLRPPAETGACRRLLLTIHRWRRGE